MNAAHTCRAFAVRYYRKPLINIDTNETRKEGDNEGSVRVYYMSFPFEYPFPDFFNLRPVAKATLSMSEATVRTPPTTAHVLRHCGQALEQKMREKCETYEVRK